MLITYIFFLNISIIIWMTFPLLLYFDGIFTNINLMKIERNIELLSIVIFKKNGNIQPRY